MNKLKNWFLTGLIAILPVVLTLYFVSWVGKLVIGFVGESFIVKHVTKYLLESNGISRNEVEIYIRVSVYILAILSVITGIILIGITLKLVIGKRIANYFERLFSKIPIIKSIYTTLSQIISIVSSDKSKSYQSVVMVEYPRKGIYSLGFLTSYGNEYFEDITGRKKLINIFIPTSPNPTSGMFIMVEESEVQLVNIKVEEAIKLIISGGAVIPENIKK